MKRRALAWGCWSAAPRPHPFDPAAIAWCGYHRQYQDPRCVGCRTRRPVPRSRRRRLLLAAAWVGVLVVLVLLAGCGYVPGAGQDDVRVQVGRVEVHLHLQALPPAGRCPGGGV